MNSQQSANQRQGNGAETSSRADVNTIAGGATPQNSGSQESYKKDFAERNLIFKAIHSVQTLIMFVVLAYAILQEDNRTFNLAPFLIIAVGLLLAVLPILGSTIYAVNKSKKSSSKNSKSTKSHEKNFAQHNLLFNAIFSISSTITLFILAYTLVSDSNLKYKTPLLWIIITVTAVIIIWILYLMSRAIIKSNRKSP